MDRYNDRVPVRTFGSGTHYDGRVWYELLRSIRTVNGSKVSLLEKSMLKQGDRVTLEYKSKTYSGVVVIETIVECPLSQDLRLASLSVVPPEPKRQLEPELDLKLDQNLERRALGRRQGRSTSEPPRQKHEPPPKPEQEHEPPPPRQDLKLPPGQDHNSPRQKHEPPRSAGIRASPRKRTCSRGQTTPPKKQKVLTGKKMISKRAGYI